MNDHLWFDDSLMVSGGWGGGFHAVLGDLRAHPPVATGTTALHARAHHPLGTWLVVRAVNITSLAFIGAIEHGAGGSPDGVLSGARANVAVNFHLIVASQCAHRVACVRRCCCCCCFIRVSKSSDCQAGNDSND